MEKKRKSLRGGKNKTEEEIPVIGSANAPTSSAAVSTDNITAPSSQTVNPESNDLGVSDDDEGGTRIGDIYIPPPIEPYCSTESKGPRLIIKKIENNNFKSYAGTVTLGPFHHCFTAIIGPNGSGKSNVIDSMLFVFGYRAQKIRCKKLSTLMHNSAKFPNTLKCSVGIHFVQIIDKEDGQCEEIPDTAFVVERTAFRDNTSFYTIDGRRVQFKEVAKRLREHHVDLDHNRFLILQGEVESIAMMKPKGLTENECGMLEYLEDIVGTTRYKEPLVKINTRVEQLTEERSEKHNRCKLAEREMKDLEQPYTEAVDYLKLENTLTRTTNLQIQKYLSEKNKKLNEYTQEHDEISKEIKEHDEQADALKRDREKMEEECREELAKFDNLRESKNELQNKSELAENNMTQVQSTMVATNKLRKQNKVQLDKCYAAITELSAIPEKNEKEISECESKVEKLSKQKSNLEEELQQNYSQLEEQTKPLIEEREKLATQLIDLKKDVDEAKADLALSESELKILKHEETAELRKYESLKTAYEESQSDLKEKQEKMNEMQGEMPDIQRDLALKSRQLQNTQHEEETLSTKLRNLRAEISEKTRNMQSTRSNNRVLDFLMRQKNDGKIPGILGRLGDLGAIDGKFDVAISTACGRLDNIIVDCVNTAQTCIEALKQHDIGRASFVALEKVKHFESKFYKIQTPENSPRLFDLIRVEDERVLPAFYFALRNTLVATDLEQGTRIAYGAQRFRVVTLNGDVIETSGTMSGGGRTQIRGKMGTKVATKTRQSGDSSLITQKALEDMQVQAEALQAQINFCQEEQGRLERELNELNARKSRYEANKQKLSTSIKILTEQLPRIEQQLQEQKVRMQKTKSDAKKVANLEAQIDTKTRKFKRSEEAANKVSDQIGDIKNKIESIHGEKVKSVQNKINNTDKQMRNLNANIAKLKVECTTSERNLQKTEKQIETLKSEISNAEIEIRKLNEERTKYANEIIELTKKLEEAIKAIEEASGGSNKLQEKIAAVQKLETDAKLKRLEIEQKLHAINKKIADVKSQLPHWRNKLKPLKLHEIPGDNDPLEPLKTYTEEELNTYKLQDIQYQYSVQEEKLNSKKPNLSVIGEYINKREVYMDRVKILEDITTKRNEMRQLYDDVRKKRYNEFMKGFHIITRKLKEMYQMITQGGDAELELVDSMDPFTEGVSFSVRPPKKTWKNISNLSGGEKTLSSLALVFALHYYKPSPLYFMDEIDAALDFKNISIVAHYIKERTKNSQFIIISLRSNMFELSDYITGIYKRFDCTGSVTIRNCSQPFNIPITPQICCNNDNDCGDPPMETEFSQLTESPSQPNRPTEIETLSEVTANNTHNSTVDFEIEEEDGEPSKSQTMVEDVSNINTSSVNASTVENEAYHSSE